MSKRDPAVALSVRILVRVLFEGAYADLLFRAERRRRPGSTWLPRVETWVRTVLEQQYLLRAYVQDFLNQPLERLPGSVQVNLLCAVQRLIFAKDPSYAVVDQAVAQLQRPGERWARGLTNAVLRRIAEQGPQYLAKVQMSLLPAARASLPEFWLTSLARVLPASEVNQAAMALRQNPGLHIQAPQQQAKNLQALGCQLTPLPPAPDCYLVDGDARIFWRYFDQNPLVAFRIQDAGIAAWLDTNRHLMQTPIWDAFCAPGGKLLTLALAGLKVVGSDNNAKRLELVRHAADRLDVKVELIKMDAGSPTWPLSRQFGSIIVDAPCSASGTVGRHPEVPLRVTEADLKRLASQQLAWLQSVAAFVRPGGDIWYCTCSVFAEENEDVVAAFLAAHPKWRRRMQWHPYDQQQVEVLRLWPHRHAVAGFCSQRLSFLDHCD